MRSNTYGLTAALSISVMSAGLCGCLSQKPFLQAGDAASAEIMYSGDVANALPIARQHCAGYNRTPRLVETTPGIAYFACDPR